MKVEEAQFCAPGDALFVVVTHVFSVLTPSLIAAEREGKTYQGKVRRNIGRRKDFGTRMAYNDLRCRTCCG